METLIGYVDSNLPNSYSLFHVADGESTKRWIVCEGLDTHWLGWYHLNNGSITGLDKLRSLLDGFAGSAINLFKELIELASNVRSVAVEDRCITSVNLTRMGEDNDLSVERVGAQGWIVLGVTSHVASANVLDGNVLDVEANVITWESFIELFVVHFDRFDFGGNIGRSKGDNHTRFNGASLDTTDGNRANARDLVHILKWKAERLVCWSNRWINVINGFKKSIAGSLLILDLLLPSRVPWCFVCALNHVVAIETGDRNERNRLWVVANLLDEVANRFDDFLVSIFAPLCRIIFRLGHVHLIDGDDKLLDAEGVSKKSMLTGLAILGDTSFELTPTGGNDEDGTICLRSTSYHVLDEITMAWGIDNGDEVFWSFEFPESDIDGDTALAFGLQLVKHPGIFERAFARLSRFL